MSDNTQLAANACAEMRGSLTKKLAALDQIEQILTRLPAASIGHAVVRDDSYYGIQLMLYNHSRKETLDAIKALGGKWTKKLNPSYSDRIDYNQTVNGIPVEIYAAPPPKSCRVVLEEIEVPAHKEIRRKLVCT